MQGYIEHSGASQDAITTDRYLKTGDIGYVDEQGYVFLVDRLKEMIKVKGNQVAPAELDAVVLSHPKVTDAAVCGIDFPAEGTEYPIAYISTCVTGEQEQQDLINDVRSYVDSRVTSYKRLKGGVVILPRIPRK
jgi:4-coumarate--CoA ligase